MKREYQSPTASLWRPMTEDIMIASANAGNPFVEINFDSMFGMEDELS